MRIPIYQVDAFSDKLFGGNPAAVCILQEWLKEKDMQAIAAENNLSETAFLVDRGEHFDLRWFTPLAEVDLCGHATLASAFVLFWHERHPGREIRFATRSGWLGVERHGDLLALDLPSLPATECEAPAALLEVLGQEPSELLSSRNGYLAVFATEEDVKRLDPDLTKCLALDLPFLLVTAPSAAVDFVSRFFAPGVGVPEDPVTGSAHCTLAPYWAKRLGKTRLSAQQVSRRGGVLDCEDLGDRVRIAGRCVPYLEGWISL
ncbi:MAG: PhzF family phenazine biosynthesis protein [Planctomycetota bacterium]